ncbi:hypothetical protein C9374_003032 [Naegleria lovaniensis]|uniref:Uncharacterized protein n=1 Tax=Naegleria lovaniensis TaxID=51637 RepID=A0AA88KKL2_NAELO|nr:uncharacterized protein C9374_003032 [Naegleria lovaniensis]KAG2385883.1 hypothetical protein C9374_003032 [Naegleria lovaniensis]
MSSSDPNQISITVAASNTSMNMDSTPGTNNIFKYRAQENNEWTPAAIVSCIFFYGGFIFPPLWLIGFFYFRSQNDREYFWGSMNVTACSMCSFIIYVVAWLTFVFFMYVTNNSITVRPYYTNFKGGYLEPGEWVAILYAVVMVAILGYEFVKYVVKIFRRKVKKMRR